MESTTDLVTRSAVDLNANRPFKSMTFREKLAYIKTVITVEPLIALYFTPTLICYPALYTLELEKACRVNGRFNDTVCEDILAGSDTYEDENNRVQEIIADLHSWQYPLQNFVPLILIIFLASYSDRHKIRKPFLLVPILGELLAIIGCILCVVFMRQLPIEVQGFSQTVIPSFLGGSTTLIMAIFAYISDISTLEMRTLRIGIIQIILTVCSLLSALGGYLFTLIGYYGVLGIGGVMYLTAFCYGVIFIKEESRRPKYEDTKACCHDLFDPMHAINTLKLLIPKNKAVKTKQLYLVLIVFFISALVTYGEALVFWLFALKTYGFTPVEYSYFDSFRNVLIVIGSSIFLPLFTKVFKLHDAVIIIITFLDKVVSNLLLIIFVNTYGLYAGTVVANCHSIANTALRSLLTKSVEVRDLAKALSLMSLCETLANILAAPAYNRLYTATLADYPEGYLILAVILFGLCSIVITFLYCCCPQIFTKDTPAEKPKKKSADTKQSTATDQTTKL